MLYFNSFVAIKILLRYDCFNKNSVCLHTTPFTGNIFMTSACFYMDMSCFGPVRVVSSLLQVGSMAADILGWVVEYSFGCLRMVSGGFGWFVVLVVANKIYYLQVNNSG